MPKSTSYLVATHFDVFAEVEVIIKDVKYFDKFLVIASDYIWEFISSQCCVRIISNFYRDNNIEKVFAALMYETIKNWNNEDNMVDDITFIILFSMKNYSKLYLNLISSFIRLHKLLLPLHC